MFPKESQKNVIKNKSIKNVANVSEVSFPPAAARSQWRRVKVYPAVFSAGPCLVPDVLLTAGAAHPAAVLSVREDGAAGGASSGLAPAFRS